MQNISPGRLCRESRRGTTMIEMALILPILIMLVVACIDFGRFGYWFVSVTNAAREGAWHATAFPRHNDAAIWQAQIAEVCAKEMGVDAAAMPAGWVSVDTTGTDQVGVTVAYGFEMLIRWPTFAETYTISRRTEMRALD